MLKFAFASLFTVLLTISTFGQTAKEWLDQVSSVYDKTPTYYIKFEIKETGDTKADTGEVFAAKEKYNLNVMGINQIYDGKTLYTISKEDKEVAISIPDKNSDDLLTPIKVLGMYKTGYTLSLDKTATINNKKVQLVKLTPTQAKSDVKHILVAIDSQTKTLQQFQEVFKNGNARTITVKDYIENLIIPRALFKFDKSKYEKDGYVVTQI